MDANKLKFSIKEIMELKLSPKSESKWMRKQLKMKNILAKLGLIRKANKLGVMVLKRNNLRYETEEFCK